MCVHTTFTQNQAQLNLKIACVCYLQPRTVFSLLEQRNLTDQCDTRLNTGRGARVRGQAFFWNHEAALCSWNGHLQTLLRTPSKKCHNTHCTTGNMGILRHACTNRMKIPQASSKKNKFQGISAKCCNHSQLETFQKHIQGAPCG